MNLPSKWFILIYIFSTFLYLFIDHPFHLICSSSRLYIFQGPSELMPPVRLRNHYISLKYENKICSRDCNKKFYFSLAALKLLQLKLCCAFVCMCDGELVCTSHNCRPGSILSCYSYTFLDISSSLMKPPACAVVRGWGFGEESYSSRLIPFYSLSPHNLTYYFWTVPSSYLLLSSCSPYFLVLATLTVHCTWTILGLLCIWPTI